MAETFIEYLDRIQKQTKERADKKMVESIKLILDGGFNESFDVLIGTNRRNTKKYYRAVAYWVPFLLGRLSEEELCEFAQTHFGVLVRKSLV